MNRITLPSLMLLTKTFNTPRLIRSLTVFALAAFTAAASAAPMSYTFDIATTVGTATGYFSGFDVNKNNVLVKDELQHFSIHATGTVETGPISFPSIESVVTFFFNRDLLTLDFFASNGIETGDPGFRGLECTNNCLAGSGTFRVYSDSLNFPHLVENISFAPTATVSTPATFTLFGLGLAGLGWSMRRSRKYVYCIHPGFV